jgi:anthranilate phosphoribosyltransferase
MTAPADAFRIYLHKAAAGEALSADDTAAAVNLMMEGAVSVPQMAGFLAALAARGETADEILGAAQALRARMLRVTAPSGTVDVVGTGGDAKGTYNVSTCTAFVVAGAGVPVAKHGNRSVSSKSGAADVLEALGVNIACGPERMERAIAEAGIGFLFAPAHHGAMKHVAPARKELGVRTIFNLVGPLSNPADTRRMLIGVFAPRWLEPIAETLRALGAEHVWVVHGAGGLDELSTLGPSEVVEMRDGTMRRFAVTPEEAGLAPVRLEDLQGGGPQENANAIRAVLTGEPGPFRDIVLLNAGAALIVAGRAHDLAGAVKLAASSIDGGGAMHSLAKLVEISNSEM